MKDETQDVARRRLGCLNDEGPAGNVVPRWGLNSEATRERADI